MIKNIALLFRLQKHIPVTRHITFLLRALIFLRLLHGASSLSARPATLTNAADVLSLSTLQASNERPISVVGVVTAAPTNWGGRFFVQDASGGVFVYNPNAPGPTPGDLVSVTGISHPGGYAPVIARPHWRKVGTAPLPTARPVTIDRLMSGTEDGQRVEISGIVRAAQMSGPELGLELVSGGYRLRAYVPPPAGLTPSSLVGAKVLLRGTAAAAFNAPLRHFVTVTLFAPQAADLTILEPGPTDPFASPLIPLNGIAQFQKDTLPGNEVHIRGIVTYQRKGQDFFLQDSTGGLQVKSTMDKRLFPGDEVEAVGFPAVENYLPVLEDAQFRRLDTRRGDVIPQPAIMAHLQKGYYHGDFISLKGRLIDRLEKGLDQSTAEPVPRTILMLQNSNVFFTAEADTSGQNDLLAAIPIGSLIEVSGICLLESADDGTIKSFHLLLPSTAEIRILEKPDWLTAQHLLASLMLVFAVLLIALCWTALVSKNNLILKSLVREKEAAQGELQLAHDLLEERVRERTNQLKIEMTARKESELQFRATLTERTRLAQELHDTLEQTLTGIALQMDMVASLFAKDPEDASLHLKLARNLMRQSQLDVRQSVWGLRSRASEQFNLANAMLINSQQIAGGAGIQVQVDTMGEARPLSEVVEENLMRISQEATTNAVKHSGASQVKTELHFLPRQVILQIKDNGRGFNPDHCAGPEEGHFGLLGISERAERLGGQVQITSSPGNGTLIRVEIPVTATPSATTPAPEPPVSLEPVHEERS
jgi:signal transduction histidine kinase